VLEDKNAGLNEVLDDIQKLNERDVSSIVSVEVSKSEQALLNIFAMIIDKRATKGNGAILEYEKDVHDICFLDPQELYNNLNDRRSFEFNKACFKRLKDFITKS